MDRDEVKAILELCRPGILEDKEDPLIAEALSHLDRDPELKTWFDEQQAVDERLATSFAAIEPPADLKASILAGMRAHSIQQEESTQADNVVAFETTRPTSSSTWWRQPWVGIAAAIVFLFVIIGVTNGGNREERMANYAALLPEDLPKTLQFLATEIDALGTRSFDKRSKEPTELKAYLASVGTPTPSYLPSPVEDVRSLGCFTFDFDGTKMGMICFKEDQLMHFTTVKRSDCNDEFSEVPTIYEAPGQAFKVWEKGENVYILSIQGEKEDLPEFI